MYKSLNFLSRALLAAIFLISGFMKVANFQGSVGMAASAGLPLPTISIALAAFLEIAGGIALVLGWQVRWASLALFLFLIPTTLIFHVAPLRDPAQFQTQFGHVLANLAIMGGLLKFYVDASADSMGRLTSPASVDEFRQRRAS